MLRKAVILDTNKLRPSGGLVRGFTLLEILVVLAILAALAGVVLPLLAKTEEESASKLTQTSLARLRDIVMGTTDQPGYWTDLRRLPNTMADLFIVPSYLPVNDRAFNRDTHFGWRGPYVRNSVGKYRIDINAGFTAAYGAENDPAVVDAWGRPIVLQWHTASDPTAQYSRLVSAGEDGVLQTQQDDLNAADRGDDLIVFLRRADAP